jgi:hypothetical protein
MLEPSCTMADCASTRSRDLFESRLIAQFTTSFLVPACVPAAAPVADVSPIEITLFDGCDDSLSSRAMEETPFHLYDLSSGAARLGCSGLRAPWRLEVWKGESQEVVPARASCYCETCCIDPLEFTCLISDCKQIHNYPDMRVGKVLKEMRKNPLDNVSDDHAATIEPV